MNSGLAKGKDIWIGGSDGQKDRTWYWVGTDLVWGYSNWDSGTEKKISFLPSWLNEEGGEKREEQQNHRKSLFLQTSDITSMQ